MIISTIEDAIIAQVQSVLGNTVREVKTLPGGWTMDQMRRALQFAPGVYCTFQGASEGVGDGYFQGRFTVYVVSGGANEKDRRRGNARVIGAYDMLELLLPRLSILRVADVGTMECNGVDNLFRDAMFDLGGTVYGIKLVMPNMPFVYEADESALADFVLWHGEAYNPGGIDAGEDPLIISEQTLNE